MSKNAFSGNQNLDPNATLNHRLDRLLEMVQRLHASQIALISTLKEVPASDGEKMLNPKRWPYFQKRLDEELHSFGLK
jgi:hypothetical protein